jgi:hypothetical protein
MKLTHFPLIGAGVPQLVNVIATSVPHISIYINSGIHVDYEATCIAGFTMIGNGIETVITDCCGCQGLSKLIIMFLLFVVQGAFVVYVNNAVVAVL